MRSCFVVFAVLMPCVDGAVAAEPRKEVTVTRLSAPPVIDSLLDESLWSSAALIDDFAQIRPRADAPPSERTEVLITYDKDALYIGARFWDGGADGGITANIMRQGSGLGQDDRLAILLDPFDSARSGYRFEVNLNSGRNDMLYQGNSFSGDWTVIWDARAQRTDYGWSVEIAIPFKTLPFDAKAEAWGFNVSRVIRRRGEESLWVSRHRTWNPGIVGALKGIRDVDQGAGLDVVPTVGIRHLRTNATGQRDSSIEPSLHAYYRVTPSLNASLTLNTVFSATELDHRLVPALMPRL